MDFTKPTGVTPGSMMSELDPNINKLAGGQDSPAGERAWVVSELIHANPPLLQPTIQRFRSWAKISLLVSFEPPFVRGAKPPSRASWLAVALSRAQCRSSRKWCSLGLKHTGTAAGGILYSLPTLCLPKPNGFFSSNSASAIFMPKK